MVLEEVQPDDFEKYPKFDEVGDGIEGNLYAFDEDGYGNQRMVFYCGNDENDAPKLAYLPSHTHLQRFYSKLAIGDYVRVELKKLIEPKEEGRNPTKIYKVLVDDERKVEFSTNEADDFEEDVL